MLKRKVRLLPFFLLRSLSVLPPYSPHLCPCLPHLVWLLGFLAEVRIVISLLFWTSYVKIFVIWTVYIKYSFLVHSLSFCFVLFHRLYLYQLFLRKYQFSFRFKMAATSKPLLIALNRILAVVLWYPIFLTPWKLSSCQMLYLLYQKKKL